jgi:hypothetical protein
LAAEEKAHLAATAVLAAQSLQLAAAKEATLEVLEVMVGLVVAQVKTVQQ